MRFSFKVIKYFLISRILVISSVLLGTVLVPTNTSDTWNVAVPFFNLFARWDSGWYLIIANVGYSMGSLWAFRPLFPLALKIGSLPLAQAMPIDVSITIVGFFLNMLFFLLALFVIHNLTQRLFSEKTADTTVLLLAFSPMAIFFSAVYSEPLFLLLISLSFFLLETEKVYRSSITGFLAGLTRPEGFLVFIPTILKNNSKIGLPKKIIATALIFCSVLTTFLLAWAFTGDPLIVITSEQSWEAVKLTLIQALGNLSATYNQSYLEFYAFSIPFIMLCLLVLSHFAIKNRKSIRNNKLFPYYAYTLVLLVFYLALGDVRSLARFASTLIPVYWGLAILVENKTIPKYLLFTLFTALLIAGSVLFANWYLFI
jgi:Gpi18-like mannosyltransferase